MQRPWLWLRHAGVDDATAGHVDIRLACPLDDRIVAHDVKAKHHQHQGPRSHGILAACPLINPRALSSRCRIEMPSRRVEMPHRDAKSTSRDAASRSQARRDPPTAGIAIECPPRCCASATQRRLGTTPWPSFLVGQGDVIHFAACFLVELPRRAGSKFTYNVTKDERTIYKENVEANATGIPG